ncbi:coiled-coil domain-containing protein 25 [Ditylenchus destructor]|nr:coiled-coil domain-containing protein 25 [Ditylenchus destructor]
MVLYFTSDVTDPPTRLFMGRDKEENELLIRWGWPEDVWFHVDKLSSAHVYLRLQPGQTIDDISPELVQDCCQLTKANSIEGNKKNNVDVIYTMWSNLKKAGYMAVGQVGFHSDKAVKKVRIEKRVNEIVNRLNKTKVVADDVDFQAEREERDVKERLQEKERIRLQKNREQAEQEQKEREKQMRSYDKVFVEEKMKTNRDGNDSDDFM